MRAPTPFPSPSSPSSGSPGGRTGRAVVLGAGMAGMLAAAALARHAGEVVIVERDRLPEGMEPRKGLPQARHAHLMMSGGARAVESLLPGTIEGWVRAGARRIPLGTGLVAMGPQGWYPRWPGTQFLMACTRDLLDMVVREQVLALPGVTLREETDALALLGNAQRVTGVKVRAVGSHSAEALEADLVVDASGRGSQAARRLTELGLHPAHEETVDTGMVYVTRIFRAPAGSERFPVVSVQADPRGRQPGQGATMVPVEGGRWLLTACGTRGGEPSREAGEFEPFVRSLRHPLIADLIADREPLTDVHLTRSTVNRRRYFERMPAWPEGFAVVGDAVATFNPVYGQGMSVAAHSAVAIRGILAEQGLGAPGLARHIQRAVGRAAGSPWDLATGEDINYPGAIGEQPPAAARLLRGYVQRLMRTATVNPVVMRSLFDVMTLSAPMTALVKPPVVLGVLRGPGRAVCNEPSITAAELALCGLGPRLGA
ncbi:FAD-dependent oxidoreductase [Streptomyces rectiverticillatus]|uniref:FAD-dependent monooxygenase n=1 Tax=Streptomyces rectiverticillatus TaxID=173860 RepID=UPI0015C370A0|nr:FAD-dependent monooxygenase [Streptomyces rectiverticillatus]QLE70971.1 FAD-dependent oxidoreductase [Streptomyces rectiverticillatus]